MNYICLTGRIANDLMYIPFDNNRSVRRFAIAFRENIKANGEDDTFFIECEAWDSAGEKIGNHCTKGDKIGIVGRIVQRKFQRKDGSNGSKIVIIVHSSEFFDLKKWKEEKQEKPAEELPVEEIKDDDLPF